MTRSITKLFVVALTLTTISLTSQVQAGGCHSGGGGGYGGGYGGYSRPSFPTYRHTPSFSSRPRVIESQPAPQFQPQQQFQGQQPAPQQQAPQQQQFQQQPQQQAQQPQQQQAPAQNGLNALGGNQQQQAPAAQQQQQTAEQSALQALAGMGGGEPQQQPQAAPQQQQQPQASNGSVGTWVAKVGDKATVRLDLRADGSFTWTATRDGKTSNFSGSYSTDGGKLTLTRSDNQSLAGAMTINTNGFNFKLDGAKDNGLTFARA